MADPFQDCFIGAAERHLLKAEANAGDYAVHVGLPPRYEEDDLRYPLLIALDANYCFGTVYEAATLGAMTGDGAPIIVAGVGTAGPVADHASRRLRDYLPEPFLDSPDATPTMKAIRMMTAAKGLDPDRDIGQGDAFLAFLTDQLIPFLSDRYRIDPAQIGLAGHSAGGLFSCYAMLRAAPPFSRFIMGSFGAPWLGSRQALAAQRAAAAEPSIRIFHGVGGAERASPLTGPDLAATDAFLDRLADANPGIALSRRVFEDESHASVLSHVMSTGLRTLWPGGGPATARR